MLFAETRHYGYIKLSVFVGENQYKLGLADEKSAKLIKTADRLHWAVADQLVGRGKFRHCCWVGLVSVESCRWVLFPNHYSEHKKKFLCSLLFCYQKRNIGEGKKEHPHRLRAER